MKTPLLALLLAQSLLPTLHEPTSFRYERTITLPSAPDASNACVTLDAAVYAHAEPSLKDLRLFRDGTEVPYAITLSEPAETDTEPATVRNLGQSGEQVVFDLAMPARPYTDVLLDLDARNFIASAEVTADTGAATTHLGTFTLFDLTAQRLGRGTTLPLQESTFPILHVALRFASVPGSSGPVPASAVRGATVPPSREAQTLYTVVAETTNLTQQGRETVARLPLPAHVPVERVSVALAPGFTGSFSRDVTVTARASRSPQDDEDERLTGLIERVHLDRAGRELRREQLGFPATLGANLQADATVEVRIQNGDDPPLPLRAVRLAMRERRLCFPTGIRAGARTSPPGLKLFYGDPTLEAPRYDFARLFAPSAKLVVATLSEEAPNPHYTAQKLPLRSLTERHPELLWVTLLAVVCILAVVAIHSAKRLPR